MKTSIVYRLYTVAVYTLTIAFIALVANGLYHASNDGVDLFNWGVYYGIYVYTLLVHVRKDMPDLPSRLLITLTGLAAAIPAHILAGPIAAAAAAVFVPLAILGLINLVVYVIAGSDN